MAHVLCSCGKIFTKTIHGHLRRNPSHYAVRTWTYFDSDVRVNLSRTQQEKLERIRKYNRFVEPSKR